jgi:hypothetical protein
VLIERRARDHEPPERGLRRLVDDLRALERARVRGRDHLRVPLAEPGDAAGREQRHAEGEQKGEHRAEHHAAAPAHHERQHEHARRHLERSGVAEREPAHRAAHGERHEQQLEQVRLAEDQVVVEERRERERREHDQSRRRGHARLAQRCEQEPPRDPRTAEVHDVPAPCRRWQREERQRYQRPREPRQVDVAVESLARDIRRAPGEHVARGLPVDREVVPVAHLLVNGREPDRGEGDEQERRPRATHDRALHGEATPR